MVNVKPFDDALDFADAMGTVRNLAAGPVESLAVGAAPAPTVACGSPWTPTPRRTGRRTSPPMRTPGCAIWTA